MNKILIYILLSLILFNQIINLPIGNGIILHPLDIGVAVVIVIWIIQLIYIKKLSVVFNDPINKAALLFILIGFTSLILNNLHLSIIQMLASSLYLIRWFSYFLIYLYIKNNRADDRPKILRYFIIINSIIVLFGFVQYIFYPDLRNLYYLGWDEHLYRLFTVFLDPNFAAVYINFFIFLLLSFIFNYSFKNKIHFYCILILLIISFFAMVLTYSRGGYLMFIIGSMLILWFSNKKRYILGIIVLLLIIIFILQRNITSEGVNLLRTTSIFARTKSMTNAVKIIKDHPLLGIGFNTYRYAQKQYNFISDKNFDINHAAGGTDNSFLFVLATTGIVGLIAYLYLLYKVFIFSVSQFIKSIPEKINHTLALTMVSALIGLVVNSFFNNSLFYPEIMLFMWLLLGFIASS